MIKITVATVLLVLSIAASAQVQQRTYRDNMGRTTGSSTTDSRGNTIFRDNMGRETGRATTDQRGNTTIRDLMGREVGTIREQMTVMSGSRTLPGI